MIEEHNYFFRMSKYAEQLANWIEENPDFIRPASRKNEVLGALKKGVGDLCITRPATRLPWAFDPWDEDYVTYVWFDALTLTTSVPLDLGATTIALRAGGQRTFIWLAKTSSQHTASTGPPCFLLLGHSPARVPLCPRLVDGGRKQNVQIHRQCCEPTLAD